LQIAAASSSPAGPRVATQSYNSGHEATKMIVNGFVEPVVKELPMEYAVELNRLIELQLEGAVG
jgi:hypothetical protein